MESTSERLERELRIQQLQEFFEMKREGLIPFEKTFEEWIGVAVK